jgi:tRNA(Ile)-lysidine synthase
VPRKRASNATPVETAFDAACDALAPPAPGARLLLGCSAGGDSMALLALAAARVAARRWTLAVVHVDHRQRPESAKEAAWVAVRARQLGIECFSERIDDALAAASPLTEDVMRRARHDIFRRRAADWSADALLLAHQADDRAETFLIRLLAGSGPTGLSSIRSVELIDGLTVVRPLLGVRRGELREWLRARGLEWSDDPSNAALNTKRGWVRHVLLPAIRDRIGLDPADRIVRAAELIDSEAQALADASTLLLRAMRLPAPPPAGDRLDLTSPLWIEAGPPLRRRLLRQWLWQLRGGHPPGYEAVAEALVFVEQARGGAELRTIDRMHIVHLKTGLLAFPPEVDSADRAALVKTSLPPPPPRKNKRIAPARRAR